MQGFGIDIGGSGIKGAPVDLETGQLLTDRYRIEGELSEILPVGAEELERCEPVYEELPGWKESTVGIKSYAALPKGARAYLERIESLAGVPIDLISTGPDRDETIVRRHPFD